MPASSPPSIRLCCGIRTAKSSWTTREASHLLFATIDAAPVRFGILNRQCFDHVLLALLVVHPDSRRRGVATTVVRRVEAICPSEKHFTSTNALSATMQRLCENEVLELIAFFVSDRAGFVKEVSTRSTAGCVHNSASMCLRWTDRDEAASAGAEV
ncbi:MAG: GNAT family N-acetyltransferase [Chloroflexota bacterium]|nr:GNAT family N-acetyltransferase [Chloroflexota bacterium]